MKVLHINTNDIIGGASRGAYWLHRALRDLGVDSKMFVAQKASDDFTVMGPQGMRDKLIHKIRQHLDPLPLRFYPQRDSHYLFTPAWLPPTHLDAIKAQQPDIINLHWICDGFITPPALPRFNRPIVWTLRDMWAMTGGCHVANDCVRYREGCGRCPQLGSDRLHDMSYRQVLQKQRHWAKLDLKVVAISNWLADCARSSAVFSDTDVRVIHNALDEHVFKPIPKAVARQLLGLPEDRKIIVFGAIRATADKNKGFDTVVSSLQQLAREGHGKDTELLIFGSTQPSNPPDFGMRATYLGVLHDDLMLAIAYSAADLTLVPSRVEAFGKTAMESMACGTPVVSFDSTGLRDIVEHQENGYRARCFDAEDFARGIAWVLEDRNRLARLSQRAREKVEAEFTLAMQAKKYLRLYEEIAGRSEQNR